MPDLPDLLRIRQAGDLLRQTKPEEKSLPKGFFKLLVFDLFEILLAFVCGFVFRKFLADEVSMYAVLAAAALWFAVSAFSALLTTSALRRFSVIVLNAAAFLILFRHYNTAVLAAAAAIIILFFFWGDLDARSQYANALKFRFNLFGRLKFGKMLTGLLLAAIILYIPSLKNGKPLLSEKSFDAVYASTATTMKAVYPAIDLNGNVGAFSRYMARESLSRGNPEFASFTPDVQDKMIDEAAVEVRKQAGNILNLTLDTEEPLRQVFYKYMNGMLQNSRESFGASFDVLWGLLLFVLIRGIGVFFVWAAGLVSFLVYQGLLATGVLAVAAESQSKETVIFG
jgi:hypothetical protein